jgi:hypothetical protein
LACGCKEQTTGALDITQLILVAGGAGGTPKKSDACLA